MGEFRFKRFVVRNERSAMKVNTDGVLLGASMTLLPSDRTLIDIGTGTGTIALMAAQRLHDMHHGFRIEGIDIDEASAAEAADNFAASPWADSLRARHSALEEYQAQENAEGSDADCPAFFDVICSNPPYFESSLKAPDERRRTARHAGTLSYRDILAFAERRLTENGRVSMILPAGMEQETVWQAASHGLYPMQIIRIRTVPGKVPSRMVIELSRRRVTAKEKLLTIQDGGSYTEEYRLLTGDFYL